MNRRIIIKNSKGVIIAEKEFLFEYEFISQEEEQKCEKAFDKSMEVV